MKGPVRFQQGRHTGQSGVGGSGTDYTAAAREASSVKSEKDSVTSMKSLDPEP